MAKPYHPCYTNVNPAAEARKYTSKQVYCRKVTLVYDWLAPDRDIESWFRRVPYRLERGEAGSSWVVKYFEFRAGIGPLPAVGFVGDLWISWNPGDPSVWFKIEENKWERWGGCASSVRERMDAKHPFLDKAYLWFSPRDFFFLPKIPDARLSLQWERSPRIRKVAPVSRIIDPDSRVPPKKVPDIPVYLPSMRTIVRTLCSNMWQSIIPVSPPAPMKPVADRKRGRGGRGDGVGAVVNTSMVQAEDPCGPFPMEEKVIGDDVKIDWDWWGSSEGEAEGETIEVGGSQPQLLVPTPTPSPIAPESLRYHPYQFAPMPRMPFKRFKPPARYLKGALNQNTLPGDPCNPPPSPFARTSTTAVIPTTPAPRFTSEPLDPDFVDNADQVNDHQGQGIVLRGFPVYPQKPSRWTLEAIARILREDGHDQSGVWVLPAPGFCDAVGDLAAALPIPVLEPGRQTSHKIRRLLRQDGFTQDGILILKLNDPSDDAAYAQIVKEDILAWI